MEQPPTFPKALAKLLEQVFAADGPARLSRRPGRIRAPVRPTLAPCRKRRSEKRVAVSDLEVTDDRARDSTDPGYVIDSRGGDRRLVRVGAHADSVSRRRHDRGAAL